jgi:hypothetical protein
MSSRRGQRHELADQRVAVLLLGAEADVGHLGDRADGRMEPLRAAITPAMKVEATAPMPGVRTPSLPVAGAICRAVIPTMISEHFTPDDREEI